MNSCPVGKDASVGRFVVGIVPSSSLASFRFVVCCCVFAFFAYLFVDEVFISRLNFLGRFYEVV